ncbi:hypothetical protein GCM10007147_31190 [Nocardiopsis kunsanensis]|uniref:HTH marR-type domain-containing protein n=1 Tax=Nocardiopsis kunsanensis TaxID=141693 RepID=A0A919CJ31_9ACTN|nr:ROK family transcriptional regulator [Nocardiopsis kunsanensis]GHD29879.1 hypothetical protein GCM10007147_31190 [Nocardiopsis kunsanensis]
MDTPVASGTRYMREVNTAAVLTQLRRCTGTSVTELARATGLSRQAVTRSISGLEQDGLVELLAPQRPGRRTGRPPQVVRFRAEAGHVLGLSLTPEVLHVVAADLGGAVVAEETAPLTGTDGAHLAETLTATVTTTLESAALTPDQLWYACLGVPGIVDRHTQQVRFTASMPHIAGDLLPRTLGACLPCPVHLDNDVKLATEGERRSAGHDRHEGPMVLVQWGERVGAGIVVFDRLYRGASNDAGDLGFLDLCVEEPEAERGGTDGLGAFEAWAGTTRLTALVRRAAERRGDHALARSLPRGDRGVDTVVEALHRGDPAATEAFEEITRRFAKGLGAVRALLDPEVVVIGGPMARCGEHLLTALTAHLQHQRLDPPRLELSALEQDTTVHGALHRALAEVERGALALPPTARLFS